MKADWSYIKDPALRAELEAAAPAWQEANVGRHEDLLQRELTDSQVATAQALAHRPEVDVAAMGNTQFVDYINARIQAREERKRAAGGQG